MIDNRFVHFAAEEDFISYNEAGEISSDSIVFIQDTGRIYTHGRFFTDYEEIRRVLFESGPGSITDAIKNLRSSILGEVSEEYNTLAKIEAFLKQPDIEFQEGDGISIKRGDTNNLILSVNVDDESIIISDSKLKVNTIDGGVY